MSEGGFQLMLILGLLGMYFDAAVVFFTISSLLFRMAVAVLCYGMTNKLAQNGEVFFDLFLCKKRERADFF